MLLCFTMNSPLVASTLPYIKTSDTFEFRASPEAMTSRDTMTSPDVMVYEGTGSQMYTPVRSAAGAARKLAATSGRGSPGSRKVALSRKSSSPVEHLQSHLHETSSASSLHTDSGVCISPPHSRSGSFTTRTEMTHVTSQSPKQSRHAATITHAVHRTCCCCDVTTTQYAMHAHTNDRRLRHPASSHKCDVINSGTHLPFSRNRSDARARSFEQRTQYGGARKHLHRLHNTHTADNTCAKDNFPKHETRTALCKSCHWTQRIKRDTHDCKVSVRVTRKQSV